VQESESRKRTGVEAKPVRDLVGGSDFQTVRRHRHLRARRAREGRDCKMSLFQKFLFLLKQQLGVTKRLPYNARTSASPLSFVEIRRV
jgi:hypothetical protein